MVFSGLNGLCNRLRTLASSKVISDHLDRKLVVYWSHPKESFIIGDSQWSDLFEYPNFEFINDLPSDGILFGFKRDSDNPGLIWEPVDFCETITDERELLNHKLFCTSPGAEFQISVPINCKNVVIQTIHNIKPKGMSNEVYLKKKQEFYSTLIPVKYVRDKVDLIHEQFSDYTVGVHIRGTDLLPFFGVDKVAYWKYLEAMEQEISQNPKVTFYVCGDSKKCLMEMKEHFGERVIINDKLRFDQFDNIERCTLKGQLDSLVDFFLLTKTQKLILTKYSSFSYEAACIANVSYVEVSYD